MQKIYSWNVNGIRAVINKGEWSKFIDNEQPDIICLQEIKAKEEQIKLPNTYDYHYYWYPADKPGYSGVAIITKQKPLSIIRGFDQKLIKQFNLTGDVYGDPNKEGRVITAEYPNFWLVSVYTPNAKDDLSRLDLRSKSWDPAFLSYLKSLESSKPVIACGDLNVAHTEDDLANPKPNVGKKGFTNEERQAFQAYIDNNFIDAFRLFKQGNGYYSWWSHFAKARERNVGWRIDYFLTSPSLKPSIKASDIHANIFGSDHCPISLTLDIN